MYSKRPSFKKQPNDNPIERIAARLVVFPNETEIYVSGTCVRLATNLYLTARHVIEDYKKRYGVRDNTIDCNCWIVQIVEGKDYAIWQMDKVWYSSHTDLAVFHTIPYNDVAASLSNQPCVRLQLGPPDYGQRIVGFGFGSPKGSVTIDHKGIRNIKVDTFGAASVGEVKEVHFIKRDESRLNFPCYQVNARFDGGMSGGPVFNDEGNICGIICSSFPANGDFEEHVSYVAMLWPLMGVLINIDVKGVDVFRAYPLLELAKSKIISVVDWKKISLSYSLETEQYRIRYSKK